MCHVTVLLSFKEGRGFRGYRFGTPPRAFMHILGGKSTTADQATGQTVSNIPRKMRGRCCGRCASLIHGYVRFGLCLAAIEISEALPVGVQHFIPASDGALSCTQKRNGPRRVVPRTVLGKPMEPASGSRPPAQGSTLRVIVVSKKEAPAQCRGFSPLLPHRESNCTGKWLTGATKGG